MRLADRSKPSPAHLKRASANIGAVIAESCLNNVHVGSVTDQQRAALWCAIVRNDAVNERHYGIENFDRACKVIPERDSLEADGAADNGDCSLSC